MTALDFYIDGLKAKGFSDEKIKELTEHKDLPWLQFAEDYHNKQLTIPIVSQKSELLLFFLSKINKDAIDLFNEGKGQIVINYFLKNNNCG